MVLRPRVAMSFAAMPRVPLLVQWLGDSSASDREA